ncbi:hypothetical protein ACRAKI_18835 [Saccharothrix isguenensis]
MYVQMMCSTAYAATQAGNRAAALQWAGEADRALRGLPETRGRAANPVNATVLTPTQVQLYKVDMLWALGDSAAALHAARGVTPAQFATAVRTRPVRP